MAIPRNVLFTARTGPKTRRTRELVELAQERFSGCDVCRPDDSYDLIDDVLRPLSLRKPERTRVFRTLSCPGCESRVESGRWVLGLDRSELRRLSLSKKFDRLHKEELLQFRDFLVKHPMLGAEHPFGRMLGKALDDATLTVVLPDWAILASSCARQGEVLTRRNSQTPDAYDPIFMALPSKVPTNGDLAHHG